MKIIDSRLFQPGNIHARRSAIGLTIEGAAGVTVPKAAIAEFAGTLTQVMPNVSDCPAWRRLGRAKAPVPVAGVVEVLAVLVQRYAIWPVKFCAWRETASINHAAPPAEQQQQGIAVFETRSHEVGLAAGKVALSLVEEMLAGAKSDALYQSLLNGMTTFMARTGDETPAADSLLLAGAATARGIPWSVVHRSHYVRLGLGRCSHVLKGSESTNTASISRALSRDKSMTNRLLTEAGLPVARQRVATTLKKALSVADEIGFPMVVKPRDGNMGRAVSIGVMDKDHLRRAFKRAQDISRHVVMESLIEGQEYRLLVVNGRTVAATHRRAAQVRGDGKSTIAQLVAAENRRPDREPVLPGSMAILRPLVLDENALETLADQGLTQDSVPADGDVAFLRRESNVSRGGEGIDMTDQLHPDNRALAARAAGLIGLDVCGVDFITADPSVSWRQNDAAICEVNSRPGINIQIHALGERGHQITDALLDMLFPDDAPVAMPVIALLGAPEQTAALRGRLELAAASAGKVLAVVQPGDDQRGISLPATRLMQDTGALEWDNQIDAALIEITPQQAVRGGIGIERLALAIIAPADETEGLALQDQALIAVGRIAQDRIIDLENAAALGMAAEALGLDPASLMEAASDEVDIYTRPVVRKPADDNSFTALFIGDVGFGESYMHHPRTSELQRILGSFGHGYSLANLHGILGLSDLTIANLEVPLAARPDPALQRRKKFLGWSDPDRTVAALKQAGIDAVTLANNHSLDCGIPGLSETLMRLQGAGITSFGAGPDADSAAHPMIHRFSIGGVEHSLVVFAGFEHRRRYDRSYRWYAGGGHGGVAVISAPVVAQQIEALREVLPNPTFVAFPHWGTDYEDITDSQRQTAADLVAAGVDLIVGHGAHVTQPAEIIDGRPVLFNIGNFVWNTPGRFNKRDVLPLGLAISLHFSKRQRGGPTLRIHPILIDNFATGFQSRPVTEEEFAGARTLVASGLARRPRSLKDAVGPYLELKLRQPGDVVAADNQAMAAQ